MSLCSNFNQVGKGKVSQTANAVGVHQVAFDHKFLGAAILQFTLQGVFRALEPKPSAFIFSKHDNILRQRVAVYKVRMKGWPRSAGRQPPKGIPIRSAASLDARQATRLQRM
jgi:hypothetical protein